MCGEVANRREDSADPIKHAQLSMFERILARDGSLLRTGGIPGPKYACGANLPMGHGIVKPSRKMDQTATAEIFQGKRVKFESHALLRRSPRHLEDRITCHQFIDCSLLTGRIAHGE